MPSILTTPDHINALLPNRIKTPVGDIPLFDRLSTYIDLAEQDIIDNWLGDEMAIVLRDITANNDDPSIITENEDTKLKLNYILSNARRCIAASALHLAIPALDITLTASGLAVISSEKNAAASKERSAALISRMSQITGQSINMLLKRLSTFSEWRTCPIGQKFLSTFFPNFDLLHCIELNREMWMDVIDSYIQQTQIIESVLADTWFSHELLDALRQEANSAIPQSKNPHRDRIINYIKHIIITRYKSGKMNVADIMSAVTYVRDHINDFPEFIGTKQHRAITTSLHYENRRNANGYIF